MLKLSQFHNNGLKRDYYLVNFTSHPIFAVHSKNGIGLPDSIMVVRLFLVQFVLVRIQVGQPKKKEAVPIFRGGFFMPEKQRVKRAQCIEKAKTSLLDFCIGDALIKLRSNLRSRV